MGEIEPVDPFEPLETDEKRESSSRAPSDGAAARPDWLVGADEGVAAELERSHDTPTAAPSRPALFRPELSPEDSPAPRRESAEPVALRLPTAAAPSAAAAPSKPVPERPVAWTAAASSLPTLRVVQGGAPEPKAPPDARLAPDLRLAPRPVSPTVAPEALADEMEFPDDAGPTSAPAPGPGAPVRPRSAPPREAWWLIAVDALRGDVKVQILAGLLIVLACAVAFWPRQERSTSLSSIRHDPHVWDGRRVRISGRVGEVFQVGGGYAFYLHQGRDTLVVFTRSRTPHMRERLSVKGSISTGWLDGRPRQALFEDAAP
jgi:hypothetical protein